MIREPIYAALFQRIRAVPGFVTASRRLKHWSDVAPSQQPALFQVQKRETPRQSEASPTIWRGSVEFYVYVNAGADPNATPAAALNTLLDAIEAALAPDPFTLAQTLGGLVSHCWVGGPIETDEGALGEQAVAIIPVEFLVAG